MKLAEDHRLAFFKNQPRIRQKLQTLDDVGLGYVHLGQSATTLSGGEAQRVTLAAELSKRDSGRTLFILDEPTTGLHFEDVRLLLEVLQKGTNEKSDQTGSNLIGLFVVRLVLTGGFASGSNEPCAFLADYNARGILCPDSLR